MFDTHTTIPVLIAASLPMLALLLDRLFGEPQRFHPLAGFGMIAGRFEKTFNRGSTRRKKILGLSGVLVLTLPPALLPGVVSGTAVYPFIELVILILAIGAHSLSDHALNVATALENNRLDLARQAVGRLVSRDTNSMNKSQVARATVESVLENGNDAVFGALFWFALAGAPGVILYRLINTLDAMWGYRNARYRAFGKAAARLDDVMNYLPARLTALTYSLFGRLYPALKSWRLQASAWESPNAGPVMAAGAGSLGIQLGGDDYYHGQLKQRPILGQGKEADIIDIRRALRLLTPGYILWALLIMIGTLLHA